MLEQRLRRKYAPLRCLLLWGAGLLAFWGLTLSLGFRQLFLLPLSLALVVGTVCLTSTCTYCFDGERLAIYAGRGRRARLLETVSMDDILSCGVFLPGQLSARRATRLVRAYLPLDTAPKYYLRYRLGPGTGLIIFSPDEAMRAALIREQWLFQVS